MTNFKKYDEDKARSLEIGAELERRVLDKFGPRRHAKRDAARAFSALVDISNPLHLVYNYCRGPSPERFSSGAYLDPIAKRHLSFHLQRLALFYQLFEIPEDDRVVQLTKEMNPHFQYPPKAPETACEI